MWKLVLSQGNEPWLKSVNHNIGRQYWEFDPEDGTPDERAHLETLRTEFHENRFNVKQSSDLLMRYQYERGHPGHLKLPSQKVRSEKDITEDVVANTLRKALRFYSTLQAEDGQWPGDYGGPLFLLPGLVISLWVMGVVDVVLPNEHQKEICRYAYNHQVLGVYDWSGNNPLPPEIWILPYSLPIHPGGGVLAPLTKDQIAHLSLMLDMGYNGSQLWDVAFSVQAILATNLDDEYGSMLKKANSFIKVSQAALLLSRMPSDIIGQAITRDQLFDAVNFILSLQNDAGGFPSYEPTRSYAWLEVINPAETFRDIIIDYQ
ncbi:hypothetical protein RJ639_037416 [Escallonia herrerae]|uniref:Cycloartenol synthase n=1 Tax=Escallonia herrerae TaxID=1293975 RepID=A0AA88WQR1_9ASTE|nr:hypothetical protein RJ639_037416 [Escallonia herrerae]